MPKKEKSKENQQKVGPFKVVFSIDPASLIGVSDVTLLELKDAIARFDRVLKSDPVPTPISE